jgi:hypothetical protein
LGFSLIDAVDINNYDEGAGIVFDLTEDNIAQTISQRYDLVLETGTLEHIFDVPKVLRHMYELTKVGGFIIHMVPSNNYVDHGFYQFSPTLFFDYYRANKFEILSMEFLRQEIDQEAQAHAMFRLRSYSSENYIPGMLDKKCFGGLDAALYSVNVCVRKSEQSLSGQAPNQSRYERIWKEVKGNS